jgi:hypothetical protein
MPIGHDNLASPIGSTLIDGPLNAFCVDGFIVTNSTEIYYIIICRMPKVSTAASAKTKNEY